MTITPNGLPHKSKYRGGVRSITTFSDALERRILREKHGGFLLDPNAELYIVVDGRPVRRLASEVAQRYVANAIEENRRDPAGEELRNRRVKLFVEWGSQVGGKEQ